MSLLLPLGLLAGLSLPALVVLYLLKVRRKPRRVGSTMLWERALEDARANAPMQKLRRNLLMILQLIALALLALAAARPVMNLARGEGGTTAILVDVSASMGARLAPDSPETRLDEARRRALARIESLSGDARALIVAYADRPRVVTALGSEKARLREGLASLAPEPSRDDLRAALSLAVSLLESSPDPRIVILSDRAELASETVASLGDIPVAVEAPGDDGSADAWGARGVANAGWTAFDLRRRPGESESYDLFGRIAVHGGSPREAVAEIRVGERLVEARRVALDPDAGETRLLLDGIGVEAGEEPGGSVEAEASRADTEIRATLRFEADVPDALSMDDEIVATVRAVPRMKVLLCSPGNDFLARALAAIGDVEVTEIAPGDPVPGVEYVVAVHDRGTPSPAPALPALWIGIDPWGGTPSDDAGTTTSAAIRPGPITHWDADHPVSSLVQWGTIAVYETKPLTVPAGARALVEAGEHPMLALGRVEGSPALVLAFDVLRSNFPLRSGFPIFLRAAIDRLAEGRRPREVRLYRGGESPIFRAPAAEALAFAGPDGARRPARPDSEGLVALDRADRAGLWTLVADGRTVERFGVAPLDARESDPAIGESIRTDAAGAIMQSKGERPRVPREIWRALAAAVLALLVIEWWAYRRTARAPEIGRARAGARAGTRARS